MVDHRTSARTTPCIHSVLPIIEVEDLVGDRKFFWLPDLLVFGRIPVAVFFQELSNFRHHIS